MTQKKQGLPKAKVFIWPNLNKHDAAQAEEQCIASGYTQKRKVKVGRVTCWEVS